MAVNQILGDESNILAIYFLWAETSSVWFVESWDFCFCCETGDAPKPELKTPQGQWFQDVSSRAGVKSPPNNTHNIWGWVKTLVPSEPQNSW